MMGGSTIMKGDKILIHNYEQYTIMIGEWTIIKGKWVIVKWLDSELLLRVQGPL